MYVFAITATPFNLELSNFGITLIIIIMESIYIALFQLSSKRLTLIITPIDQVSI